MLRRDSPTPREHMSERLWMRDRMTLLHSVCHHHEFVKTSHRGSHETCSPQVLTEPRAGGLAARHGGGLRRRRSRAADAQGPGRAGALEVSDREAPLPGQDAAVKAALYVLVGVA